MTGDTRITNANLHGYGVVRYVLGDSECMSYYIRILNPFVVARTLMKGHLHSNTESIEATISFKSRIVARVANNLTLVRF